MREIVVTHGGIIYFFGHPFPEILYFIASVLCVCPFIVGVFTMVAAALKSQDRVRHEARAMEFHARMAIVHMRCAKQGPDYEARCDEFGQWLRADIRHVQALMNVINEPAMQRFVLRVTSDEELQVYASALADAKQQR